MYDITDLDLTRAARDPQLAALRDTPGITYFEALPRVGGRLSSMRVDLGGAG